MKPQRQPRLSAEEKVEAILGVLKDVHLYRGRKMRLPTTGHIVATASPEARGFIADRTSALGVNAGRDVMRMVQDRLLFACVTAPQPPEDAYIALTEEELATRCWLVAEPLGFRFMAPRLLQWTGRGGEMHPIKEPGYWLLNDHPENTLAIERTVRAVLSEIAAKLDDPAEQSALVSAHKQGQVLRKLESIAAIGAEAVLADGRTTPAWAAESPDDPFGDTLFLPGSDEVLQ